MREVKKSNVNAIVKLGMTTISKVCLFSEKLRDNYFKCWRTTHNSYFTCLPTANKKKWSSYKGRRANALASEAEEGRGKLRKAAGSGKHTSIRRYPNGAIRLV